MSAPFAHDRPDFVAMAVRHATAAQHPDLDPAAVFPEANVRGCSATARARQLAIYVMSARLDVSQFETGRKFSRDRTTALHAVHTVAQLVERCPATAKLVDRIERDTRHLLDLFAMVEAETHPTRTSFHG